MILEILKILWIAGGRATENTLEEQIRAADILIEIKNNEIKRQNKIIKHLKENENKKNN